MRSLNIKSYTLKDFQKITSKWVSDILNNFVDNFMYLFDGFKKLNEKHEIYRTVSDQTMDFLYANSQANSDPLVITAYQTPYDSTDVVVKQAYNHVSLAEDNVENLIPLIDSTVSSEVASIANDDDGNRALGSARIYRYDPASPNQLEEDLDLRRMIDDTGYIWYTEMTDGVEQADASQLGITLSLPTDTQNEITYIEIYPYGGTGVESITFKGQNENDETFSIIDNSSVFKQGYPIRLHVNKKDFSHEINIVLNGYDLGSNNYFYSIGHIKAYVSDFVNSGRVAYSMGAPGTVTSLEVIRHFAPDSVENGEIDIKIVDDLVYGTANEDDGRVYDTSDPNFSPNEYPMAVSLDLSSGALPGGATEWIIIFTLNNTDDASPVFKRCDLTVS